MNIETGEIKRMQDLTEDEKKSGKWKPLTAEQLGRFMGQSKRVRINLMRNEPCPCGSGKKFKRCCLK